MQGVCLRACTRVSNLPDHHLQSASHIQQELYSALFLQILASYEKAYSLQIIKFDVCSAVFWGGFVKIN